ncbi:S9 family peptidase [Arthrobacter sp. Marseille-P9274]|uniref:alpha/beta hydrolase family protein n=1 Tax=Arthrobacter sp. Marseille-P9274 TaxID=2866572 RepID=UPI0021C8511B|nr:S9 family peptidase [Arthrobacter sp. Marseille-P9274]
MLVWNPGYGSSGAPTAAAGPTNPVKAWLLDQGYALAGTTASSGGWAVEDLVANQPDVLRIVSAELGEPEEVIAWGESMGGLTSAAALEAHPELIDAALPLCGSVSGAVPMLNGGLDGTFVLRMLLAPDDERLELADVRNEAARQAAFREVLEEAQATPQGRARIALAASAAQIPAWTQASDPEPSKGDLAAQQEQLYAAFMFGVVSPRQPLEARAGGNFSWNTGVDYGQSLVHSGNAQLVRALYREAGLSLSEDLGTLASSDRIAADPRAVAYMQENATPEGKLSGPVLTLHETGDTAPTVAQAATYEDRVRANGDNALLRQAFVDRPGHCDYADAEIAAMVTTLHERLDEDHWADLAHPASLNALADRITAESGLERGGSFASYAPNSMLRPEREVQR